MTGLQPAGFWIRVAARLIDTVMTILIITCAMSVLLVIATIVTGGEGRKYEVFVDNLGDSNWLTRALLWFAYHGMFEGIAGTTIGKRLLRLHVIDTGVQPITFMQAIKRSAVFPIDALFFGLVGWYHMKKSPARQRLGDEWADTQVVFRESLPPGLLPSTPRVLAAMVAAAAVTAAVALVMEVLSYLWLVSSVY